MALDPTRRTGRARPPELSEIVPRLWVGEYPRPEDLSQLAVERGVSAIVSLQDDVDLESNGLSLEELEEGCRTRGIEFRRVPVTDGDPRSLARAIGPATDAIQELYASGRTVLLHCNAGFNRSPTIAIAWLVRHGGMSLAEATEHVRRRRVCLPYLEILTPEVLGSAR
jgi:protein-tyrosine phosphatase